uniref:hypothetical protein n=1 Tax=Desulfovibrio sp. TaxID=885 RepID=UPI003FD8692B
MSYLISYDLNAPGKNYDQLYDAIKSLGGWWHHLDSTWIVTHAGPATAIRDKGMSGIHLAIPVFSKGYR